MGYFQVRYDFRVVNYDRRGFIRLYTGKNDCLSHFSPMNVRRTQVNRNLWLNDLHVLTIDQMLLRKNMPKLYPKSFGQYLHFDFFGQYTIQFSRRSTLCREGKLCQFYLM